MRVDYTHIPRYDLRTWSVPWVNCGSAVRFSRDSTDHLRTAHHSYAFLMYQEGYYGGSVAAIINQNKNQPGKYSWPRAQFTTSIHIHQIHHIKTTFMCPRSIAGVPSARVLAGYPSTGTTCMYAFLLYLECYLCGSITKPKPRRVWDSFFSVSWFWVCLSMPCHNAIPSSMWVRKLVLSNDMTFSLRTAGRLSAMAPKRCLVHLITTHHP